MNDVSDNCLATRQRTTEKILEFRVGIEPTASITPGMMISRFQYLGL